MDMKWFNLILVALLFCSVTACNEIPRSEQIRNELLNPTSNKVLVVSHRADWRNYPENSMEAINSAIEMGVDILEIDIQCTADSQLILMHDSKIDRTTTGKGRVSEMTLDSIQQFKLKNGVNIRTRYHIPTLHEVLLACKGKVLINLDKADRYFDLVVPLLEETGTTRQIIMKGRRPANEVDSLYGKYLDELIYMPIVAIDKSEDIDVLKDHIPANRCAFELTFREEPTYMIQAADLLKGTSRIWVNCLWDTLCGGHEDDQALLDPEAHYGYLINTLGASIIQTDRPEFLITYLKAHNLH